MDTETKVRENRLRRWATRLGWALKKSRARKWSIDDYQGYMLVDIHTNMIEYGEKFDIWLDDVEEFLQAREEELREL